MRRIFKIFLLALLLLLTAMALGMAWYRNASSPAVEGRLQVQGLAAAVEVVRDAEGIPHIYARSPEDAYFGLGFAHAQDRLWQLEMHRRIAAGRLAEIFGPGPLDNDRFLRTLGIRRNAERIFPNLKPEVRAALEAYARGINAYLAAREGPLPPEFILTGAPPPEPWEPADSIAWQTMMAWDLGGNWWQEVMRMRLSQRVSLQQINEFLAPYPGDAVLPTQDYTQLYRQLAGVAAQMERVAQAAPPSFVEGMGSNNWAVSGARSVSGKPLLANDPHLGLHAPSLWYLAHLSAPNLNVIGATLPGIPGVILGRNDRIAWGFTNTGPDVQDLYLERLHPDNREQYQTPQGWADFVVREEIIRVKGQADVRIQVRETRHGPVVSGALPILQKAPIPPATHVVAFAWTALRADDLTLNAGLGFSRARNWEEFLEAAKFFGSPQQNILYADVDGNIGFVAAGRVPIRHADNDLQGLAPAPGWDARYDWQGFIPFAELPRVFNPASQQLFSANEKIVGPDYPYLISSDWALPYRAWRIRDMLQERPKHSMESFAAMQADHLSLAAQELLPRLMTISPDSERGQFALAALRDWDGSMAGDRHEPLIFNAWMRAASRRIFADELGETLMRDYWEQRNVHGPMVNVLHNRDGQARWCRDVSRPDRSMQSCDALLVGSLEEALDELERRYGKDMADWRWGKAHFAKSEHRPFTRMPLLAKLFDIRVPTPGDTFTVNVGRHNLRDEESPYASRHAAGLRALYDLSDLENSVFIHSTGQSGHPLLPGYRSFVERWAQVQYLPMKTRRAEVEKDSAGTLVLAP